MSALLAAGDPLLNGDIDLGVFLVVCIKTLITFAVLMVAVLFMVWFERKVISDMQNRIGPNRAGPWGLLQTLADQYSESVQQLELAILGARDHSRGREIREGLGA